MISTNEFSIKDASFWKNFLSFDRFITGSVLKIIYLIVAGLIILATIVGGFVYLGALFVAIANFSLGAVLTALLLFVVNLAVGALLLLILRVYCEFIMVIFKINENLQTIRDRNEQI